MKKIFTLIAAALFAVSASAKEELALSSFNPWTETVVVSGQTITMTGPWQGGAIYVSADWTAYDYVWIKYTNATGTPNFGITYDEWQKNESWGPVFASVTSPIVNGDGVVGIKLDKESVMVKGNAETDGTGIGDVYAKHVQQITIQSQNADAAVTVVGIWYGTAAEYAADGGDLVVRPAYGESVTMWEGNSVYNGWGVTDVVDAKYFDVAKVGDIIRCTIKDVLLEDGENSFNPLFKYMDYTDFTSLLATLDTDKATYFEGTIADEEALAYLKKNGLRLQGRGFTLTKVELVNNVKDDGGDPGADGINVVKTQVENGAIYNLAGQKVDENYKGIVIMNGKKYMQK